MKIKNKYLLMRNCLIIVGMILPITFFSGCTQQPMIPSENTILIENLTFKPNSLTVQNATQVIWINNDGVGHTIVADNDMFTSGMLSTGQNFTYTFTVQGVYNYSCGIHPSMRGTIIVQ